MPRSFCKPPILSPLDEYRILASAAGESYKLNPLSCAETAAMIQELVEGTETQKSSRVATSHDSLHTHFAKDTPENAVGQ
jgi:hypothetical protein